MLPAHFDRGKEKRHRRTGQDMLDDRRILTVDGPQLPGLQRHILDFEHPVRLGELLRVHGTREQVGQWLRVVEAIGSPEDASHPQRSGAVDAPISRNLLEPERAQGAKGLLQVAAAHLRSVVEACLGEDAGVQRSHRDPAEDLEVQPPGEDEFLQHANLERPLGSPSTSHSRSPSHDSPPALLGPPMGTRCPRHWHPSRHPA